MPMFRPNRAKDDLARYWDALDRDAPGEELARLAGRVHPDHIAAISRARALHRRRRPDPVFANRLENALMDAFAASRTGATPPAPILFPTERTVATQQPRGARLPRLGGQLVPALEIGLVILLILASIAGIWLTTGRDDEPRIIVPPVATPTAEASPDVPMYRGNPERTGVFPGPSLIGTPVELWSLQAGEPINLGAAVVDGVLYWSAGTAGFEARDALTGDLLWAFPTDASAVSAPAVVDGLGYVIDSDGTLYAVHADDGAEAWRMANINVRSSVVPVDGLVYAVSPDGTFYALDAPTGAIVWQAGIGAEAAGGMAVADGLAFQGNAVGVMSAFDTMTGELRWTFQNEEGRGNATLTVANGQIYITISGGETNAMYAVDIDTGELTWRTEQVEGAGFISATSTPTLLYSIAEDGMLHALDVATGETVWTYQLLEFVRSIPVLVEDTLYVLDNGGFVRAIVAATGEQQWEYPIEGEADLGWPVVAGGVLYVGTSFGNFYAIAGSGMLAARELATPTVTPLPATPEASPVATSASGEVIGSATIMWQSTGGNPALGHATQVTIAPDGNVWVADGQNSQFQIFAPDGTLVETWGGLGVGSGDGRFNFIRSNGDGLGGVVFTPDGSFYVADTGNTRIQHFDANRQFLHAWGTFGNGDGEFISPEILAVDSQGSIFVSDSLRDDIQKFDAAGTHLVTFGGSGSALGQLEYQGLMAIAPDDTIWVADPENARIQHYANDGRFLGAITESDIPGHPVWVQSLAFDAEGRLYLADIDGVRLFVLAPTGELLGVWSLTDTDGQPNPNSGGMAIDDDGSFYLTDWLNGVLYKYQLQPPLVDGPEATPVS